MPEISYQPCSTSVSDIDKWKARFLLPTANVHFSYIFLNVVAHSNHHLCKRACVMFLFLNCSNLAGCNVCHNFFKTVNQFSLPVKVVLLFWFLDAGLSLFARHCPARHRKAPQCSHLSNSCLRPLQKRQADQVSSSPHTDLPQLFLWTTHAVVVQCHMHSLLMCVNGAESASMLSISPWTLWRVCQNAPTHHKRLHNPKQLVKHSGLCLSVKNKVCQFKSCISPSLGSGMCQGSSDRMTYFI